MDAKDRLTNQQGTRVTSDQETDLSPPGGARGLSGAIEGTNSDVAGWQGQQQSATALKEQQEADLAQVAKVADTIEGGGTFEKT